MLNNSWAELTSAIIYTMSKYFRTFIFTSTRDFLLPA